MPVDPLAVVATQAPAPPVGSVDETIFPAPQAATHSEAVGHETVGPPDPLPATLVVVQAPLDPVGSVVVTTSPPTSAAAHMVVVGQEIPAKKFPVTSPKARWSFVSTVSWSQLGLGPVGSVECTAIPSAPTATQRVVVAHETADSGAWG